MGDLQTDKKQGQGHAGGQHAAEDHQGPGKGALGQAGDAATRRMAQPPQQEGGGGGGHQVPWDNPQAMAQGSFESASLGANAKEGAEIYREGHVAVRFDPNTHFDVQLTRGGLYLKCVPGLLIDVPGPDLRVDEVSYSFESAKFSVIEHARFDIFGAYAHIAKGVTERALENVLKPRLPEKLTKPGYDVSQDKDIDGTVQALQKGFGTVGNKAPSGYDPNLKDFTSPSAKATVRAPEDMHIPLGEKFELFIRGGSELWLDGEGDGDLQHPRLKVLRVGANGIECRSTGKGVFDPIKAVRFNSGTVYRGGKMEFGYDLIAEEMIGGLAALGQLIALAAGRPVSGQVPDVKLKGAREDLDKMLQENVPPYLHKMLAKWDKVLPGFSLMELFGE